MLCATETAWLRKDLKNLPMWMGQLQLTYSRQSQTGTGNGGKSANTLVPFDGRASLVFDEVVNTIGTWIRDLETADLFEPHAKCECEAPFAPCDMESRPLRPVMGSWCAWLLQRVNRIRGHQAVAEIVRDISTAVRKVQRAVDIKPDKLFCGPCDVCGADLYAKPGEAEVVCRKCAEVAGPHGQVEIYDVEDRRDWLLSTVRSRLATAQEILTAVPHLFGVEINSGTFRSWTTRGRLEVKGWRQGKPLYSVDTALTLASEAVAKRPKRQKHALR